MSGIFGFINLDGRPASPEYFQKMVDEMAGWGPDGVGSIISGSAAFGHSLLIVTHESRFEKMPIYDQNEGILFTAAARLDNRDELCDTFSTPHPERPTTSDGQLVLKAYKKWGADSCKHIFGDWSFAAWHNREQRFFLARDHLGNTGLYYYYKPPLIVFASNIKALLTHPEVPRELNEMQLAQRMVFDYSEQTWSQTYWTDVRSLPASHAITFTGKNKQIEKYWRLDESPPVRFGSDAEYLEGFLDHFRRAVRVRLNSIRPIGTMLSAGLDSSSLTVLAAETLRENNKTLTAFTSVPLYASEKIFPDRLTDEWPLAHQVAESYDNIEHIPVSADDITTLTAIERGAYLMGVPQGAATNMFWIISLFEHAKQRNLSVMLTGQLGNGSVSWSGGRDYIYYLFARNQWNKGLLALAAWKKYRSLSWYKTVKSQILRPMLLPLWSQFLRFLRPEKHTSPIYSFPQKDFIKRMGLNEKGEIEHLTKCIDPLTERKLTMIRNGTIVGPFWYSFGTYFNMEVRDPTADIRLLEFCMGVPNEQFAFNGGERMLIRRAMAGLLPDHIRWNSRRGLQASDILERLIVQQNDMEKTLTRFSSSNFVTQYIDIFAMIQFWKFIKTNQLATPVHANMLLRVISTAYFLNSFHER